VRAHWLSHRSVRDIVHSPELTEADLAKPEAEWVRTLGPVSARWVMIATVDDLMRKVTFGTSANSEVSAYLFDKQVGRCVWRNKGVGRAGQGGLIGYFMPSASQALDLATFGMMSGFPRKSRQPKSSNGTHSGS